MWFIYALITALALGIADVFFKKGADNGKKYSHLQAVICLGLLMGIHAATTIFIKGIAYSPKNILIYAPVSAAYLISIITALYSFKFIELSIASPVKNSYGVVLVFLCFLITKQRIRRLAVLGVTAVFIGILLLAIFEKQKQKAYFEAHDKKFKIGFAAFFMPLISCVFGIAGAFLNGFYLDDANGSYLLNVTPITIEDTADISLEFAVFACAVILFICLRFIKKEKFILSEQKYAVTGSLFAVAGQTFYAFAAGGGTASVAASVTASCSIVSLILAKLFLKEKLTLKQHFAVTIAVLGIAALGIAAITAS